MPRATKSLQAALFRPTAPLSGNEPPSVFRGANYVLRGPAESPYFQIFQGNLDLGEDYNLGVTGVNQVETATVVAAAGITGNGTIKVTFTIRNATYILWVDATTAANTAAAVAALIRAAATADEFLSARYTIGGSSATFSLTDLDAQAHDSSLNIRIENGTCTGITTAATSANTTSGSGAYRLTGTLAFTSGDTTVIGTGTDFANELHLGQMILAGTQVLVVGEITSDTAFETLRAPDTSESALVGYRLPQMFEMDGKRGVCLTGNAIKFAKGHLIGVGSGELFINGQPLAGASMVLSNRPKAAIYRPATNDFIINELGFDSPPPAPSIAVISGGVKGMPEGNKFSFMVSYWTGTPEGTNGYSDPCTVIKLDDGSAVIETVGTDSMFEFDFTDSLVGAPPNAKGFRIWGNQAGKATTSVASGGGTTVTSPNQSNYDNGPWFEVVNVLFTELDGSNKFAFEYLDADVKGEVSGDNNRPPYSEYVAKVEGKPMYISCLGKRTTAADAGSNPGNSCVISKFDNPDGAPVDWSASVEGTILGWLAGVGRWFVFTPSNLDFIVSTGLYGQSDQGGRTIELPIISRPYWKTGAKNRYNIILIDDTLLGFSGNKMFKSVGSGDENVKKYDFGSVVEDITRDFNGGFVLVAQDPKHTQACVVHSAAYKNSAGYWVSEILPYSLLHDAWLPKIVLDDPTRDMIVSGVATVNEKFEFLAGGRVTGGSFQTKTYRFGEGEGESVSAYLIWNISDDGFENISKAIHAIRPSGKFSRLTVQVHGARPGNVISVDDMEDGVNSLSGDIRFDSSDDVTRYLAKKCRITKLGAYALRLADEWDGIGVQNRIEELVVEVSTHGRSR